MNTWTTEWPTEVGWYWFWGFRSLMLGEVKHLVPVNVRKTGGGFPMYNAGGYFLYQAEGAAGHWTPMVLPKDFP